MTIFFAMVVLGGVAVCVIAVDRGWLDGTLDRWGTRHIKAAVMQTDGPREDAGGAKNTTNVLDAGLLAQASDAACAEGDIVKETHVQECPTAIIQAGAERMDLAAHRAEMT